MCGISGFVLKKRIDGAGDVLTRMNRTLHSRGPDSEGYWFDTSGRVGLGHRRLAIVDLSEHGHQPMHSATGRFTITYNGEIYNFPELRQQLAVLGFKFHGGSDTEVLLAAVEAWGLRAAVDKFIGMFAFALWDRDSQSLSLVRDRLGKKPLYYGWVQGSLIFGSELKALREFPGFDTEIDRDSLALYMRHNYVPTPYSIYRSVRKLRAGTLLRFDFSKEDATEVEDRYWSATRVAVAGKQNRFSGTFDDAVKAFGNALEDAVRMRMVADVPLGAFLSGGIDSSLIVALMSKLSTQPVKTFTIGFREDAYNEAKYAKAVASHIGTDHTECYLSASDALAVVPHLAQIYCEPFADSSQIPTYLVSKIARQSVTVALSGDGGDELNCGYSRYLWMRSLWRMLSAFPRPIRRAAAATLRSGGAGAIAGTMALLGKLAPIQLQSAQLRNRLMKLANTMDPTGPSDIYRQIISHWPNPQQVVIGASADIYDVAANVSGESVDEVIESIMTVDTESYLPDDILVKVDRASMACSLEARAPLLDHRLFELVRSMPLEFQLQGTRGKLLLRSVLNEFVPESLIDRPKTGFGVPIDSWLCGPLRDWAEALLNPARLKHEGYFDVKSVRDVWEQHLRGTRQGHYLIWDVLMFQSWLDHQKMPTDVA